MATKNTGDNLTLNLPSADMDHVLGHGASDLAALRGARLLLTGGTGFFGKWLLESLLRANVQSNLQLAIVVLTRNPAAFRKDFPHLCSDPALELVAGDVKDFWLPEQHLTHVIHAATQASASLNANAPLEMFDTCVQGTRRALEVALACGAKRFLLVSSGAVYGPQPPHLSHIPEEFGGGPDCLHVGSAYAEGKRAAEWLGAAMAGRGQLEVVTARAFAFVGPHLPLDTHFAVGNFMRDALAGGPITVQGDGSATRSYLHAADLCLWLLRLLVAGKAGRAYNVGSAETVSIGQLAAMIAHMKGGLKVEIMGASSSGTPPHQYVPDTSRAKTELGLEVKIHSGEALSRTMAWHESR